jgi:beta-glucosidase
LNAEQYDYAIVAVGELPFVETAGDNLNLIISAPDTCIIKRVCKHVKCVTILILGRLLVLQPYIGMMAALFPCSEGQGVEDVLFGDYGFTGKLPQTWFKTVDQFPKNVGDKHYDPLCPFNFGLTTEPTK